MSNLPRFEDKRLIKILKKFGFEVIRVKGSHHFLKHSDGRATVVPVDSKEIVRMGLFTKILKTVKLRRKSFQIKPKRYELT